MRVWNSTNALVRAPILPEAARALGFDSEDDRFTLLQGDIVRTETAYSLGEQIGGPVLYAVLNSSCDLVPGRARLSLLLKIVNIRYGEENMNAKLSQLLKFSRRDSMYIPPLPDDEPEELETRFSSIRFAKLEPRIFCLPSGSRHCLSRAGGCSVPLPARCWLARTRRK